MLLKGWARVQAKLELTLVLSLAGWQVGTEKTIARMKKKESKVAAPKKRLLNVLMEKEVNMGDI